MGNIENYSFLALSSKGLIPKYGRHENKSDGYPTMYLPSIYCDESDEVKGVIQGDLESCSYYWNKDRLDRKIDAPEGWRWGCLEIERYYMGGKERIISKDFVGFYTEKKSFRGKYECVIDKDCYIHDLKIVDVTQKKLLDMSIPKLKNPSDHIWMSEERWNSDFEIPMIKVNLMTGKYVEKYKNFF